MTDETDAIAAAFDHRAARYSKSDWHPRFAERLVELAPLQPGQRVLDAGAGTGFAAVAIARRLGPAGRVVAVDVSSGMLAQARIALEAAGATTVDLLHADATDIPSFPSGSFDGVICSAALLYMPVEKALREWHRLLRPGGFVGFSTMREGSPPAARLFRECAREAGVTLHDVSAALGSEERCRTALEAAGFQCERVVAGVVQFSVADLRLAWESNSRSTAHAAVLASSAADLEALRVRFEAALERAIAHEALAFTNADVLYAFGRI